MSLTTQSKFQRTIGHRLLGMSKLIFGNAVGNSRSARIKEKSGAQFVRREPAHYVDPDLKERDIYELTKETWLNLRRG